MARIGSLYDALDSEWNMTSIQTSGSFCFIILIGKNSIRLSFALKKIVEGF